MNNKEKGHYYPESVAGMLQFHAVGRSNLASEETKA